MDTQIYIAGAFESQGRLHRVRSILRNIGLNVSSSWLDEVGETGASEGSQGDDDKSSVWADRDIDEIIQSDLLILDTIETNDRGGKDTEFGMAYMLNMVTWIVGPYRNVFQRLADRHFDDWHHATMALEAGRLHGDYEV